MRVCVCVGWGGGQELEGADLAPVMIRTLAMIRPCNDACSCIDVCVFGQELEGTDLAKAVGKGARIPAGVTAEELRGLERALREQACACSRVPPVCH
jgi:hypothetical protein